MIYKGEEKQEDDGKIKGRGGRIRSSSWIAYALFVLFIIFGFIWFVFFSHFFTITNFEISNLNVLEKQAVVGELVSFLDSQNSFVNDKRNIFIVDEEKIATHVMNTFFVESVTVDKSYPNILRLKIKERQRSVILVTKNKIYIVDDYGVITDFADEVTASTTKNFLSSTVPLDTLKEIFVIAPTSTIYTKGFEYTDSQRVRNWLELVEKLREAGIWFKALYLDENEAGIVRIILRENKDVVIDVDAPLDIQIETLRQFIQSKPKWEDIHEYIDVRIPGRIYFK
jgi:POTRA domain, FtsQ-type